MSFILWVQETKDLEVTDFGFFSETLASLSQRLHVLSHSGCVFTCVMNPNTTELELHLGMGIFAKVLLFILICTAGTMLLKPYW